MQTFAELLHYFVFPQVETPNPEVSVWIVNLKKPKYLFPIEIKPTNSVEPGSYVTSATFYDANNVAIIWLNRKQNISVIVTCKSQNNFNCTDVSTAFCRFYHFSGLYERLLHN